MNYFKTFSCIKFDNVKTSAMIEFNEKPLEIILNTKFSVKPTKNSIKKFNNNIEEFRKHLRKTKFGESALYRSIKTLNRMNWNLDSWCGVNYTYNHDLNEIRFDNKVSLGVDFIFYLPYQKFTKEVCDKVNKEYCKIANRISRLDNFSSDKYVIVKASK